MSGISGQTLHRAVTAAPAEMAAIRSAKLLPLVTPIPSGVAGVANENYSNRQFGSFRLLGGKLRLSIYQDALSFVSGNRRVRHSVTDQHPTKGDQ